MMARNQCGKLPNGVKLRKFFFLNLVKLVALKGVGTHL